MTKIDLKDRKILYELDLNCRQSNTQIGKKVGLKKDVVAYRINKMQEEGIIKYFWTAIDTFKLGYQVFRIYINFHYVNNSVKKEIIQYFSNYKYAWLVSGSESPIDLDVIVWLKNIYAFHEFWNTSIEKFEDQIDKYQISIYIKAVGYEKSYLLDDPQHTHKKMYETICDGSQVDIDETDYKILNELALNARIPLIDLSKKINCSSQTANYRIKNLKEKGVIQAFRVDINRSKIDLQLFKIDIYLKEFSKRNEIINYLEKTGSIECLNVATGWSDIEPEIVVQNMNKLIELIEEINNTYKNVIRRVEYWINPVVYKERWLPEF